MSLTYHEDHSTTNPEPSLYKYTIYTDGSCLNNHTKNYNSRKGGWAFIILDENSEVIVKESGNLKDTPPENVTNNVAELTAVIKAIEKAGSLYKQEGQKKPYIRVVTDSTHVKDGIVSWIKNWKKNNWKRLVKGKPKGEIKNLSLWKKLDELNEKNFIEWDWTKAHTRNLGTQEGNYNHQVDVMAVSAAKGY